MTAAPTDLRIPETVDSRTPVLAVSDLTVNYAGRRGRAAVRDVSFAVERGETVAIVGESGSGKSTVVNAILKLLDSRVSTSGTVKFDGHDILPLGERQFRPLRGRRMGFVPQDPTASLNPVRRIDNQIYEAFKTSGLPQHAEPGTYRDQALHLLESVGLSLPQRALQCYPHQLSGGQLQRILVAMAISQRPDFVVADEPTSALDVTIQKTILDLIDRLKAQNDLSVLLVTHDLSLAAERSDKVVVLDSGTVAEYGRSAEVLRHPTAAYTRELIGDIPSLNLDKFTALKERRATQFDDRTDALTVTGVHKAFGHGDHRAEALQGVSFTVGRGRTHALVGESGSGKSTLARIVLRLVEPDAGRVLVGGKDIALLGRRELREARRDLQLVYQNPFNSLDPSFTVERLVDEPLRRYGMGNRAERRGRVGDLLDLVGLDGGFAKRSIRQLSGGQRQRVAIARSLSLHPSLLVLDEPTSALDVVVQSQILQVLAELQARLGLSYLFISHDLSVVRQFADTVTVLQRGEVRESGTVDDVFDNPASDYTVALIESIPRAISAPALGSRTR